MNTKGQEALRTAVLTELVRRAPKPPGRTALMKFVYLLQTVRHVPLGYRFRLYNYGPYDEQVLADARSAADSGLLTSNLVTYPNGYGYEFKPGEEFQVDPKTREVLSEHADAIDWVVTKFGNETASRLELISTLVFANCDESRNERLDELANRVHEIKPHFSVADIQDTANSIRETLDKVN